MNDIALQIQGLSVRYGKFVALADVSLVIGKRSVHSIIGPNGAGKTTLFHAITGRVRCSGGTIILDGADITATSDDERVRLGLARSFQVTSLFAKLSVQENLRLAAQGKAPWSALFPWRRVEPTGAIQDRVGVTLERLSLTRYAGRIVGELSHGQQRRLEVGMALASDPKVLLLDEPTSGMGVDDIEEMKALIRDLGRDYTVLFIEHNMGIVMNISDQVTVMQQGRKLVEGPPDLVRNNLDVKRAYLGAMIAGGGV